ncbi:MAG: PLP-dependent transferase [Kouleothrix sp.]
MCRQTPAWISKRSFSPVRRLELTPLARLGAADRALDYLRARRRRRLPARLHLHAIELIALRSSSAWPRSRAAPTARRSAPGLAASHEHLQALAPGDHVIVPDDAYHGVSRPGARDHGAVGPAGQRGVMADLAAVRAAVRPTTRLLWVETPSNPLLKISNIAALARIARITGARCAVDNTWATPAPAAARSGGRPGALRDDKYLGGHSDVLGGAIVARSRACSSSACASFRATAARCPSPFDCWLAARHPLAGLPQRRSMLQMPRVAAFLNEHPAIERVYYPGLASHPGHAVAARQMCGFGGMLSIEVPGGEPARPWRWPRGSSCSRVPPAWAASSLIEHRASVEGPESRTPPGLLRVSVGLEHPDDLVADLAQALAPLS